MTLWSSNTRCQVRILSFCTNFATHSQCALALESTIWFSEVCKRLSCLFNFCRIESLTRDYTIFLINFFFLIVNLSNWLLSLFMWKGGHWIRWMAVMQAVNTLKELKEKIHVSRGLLEVKHEEKVNKNLYGIETKKTHKMKSKKTFENTRMWLVYCAISFLH